MTWRVAKSLDILLAEINKAAPNRSKVSDGAIGDADHASRTSDHNPWVIDSAGVGVVRARDFTHDPAGGLDCDKLAPRLAALLGKHPALGAGAYVIWEARIISTARLAEGWRVYTGANLHTKHVHLSVGTSGYDATLPWGVMATAPGPTPRWDRAYEHVRLARLELVAIDKDFPNSPAELAHRQLADGVATIRSVSTKY